MLRGSVAAPLPLATTPQHGGGEGDGDVGIELADVGALYEVPGGVGALVPQHLSGGGCIIFLNWRLKS